MKVFIRPPLTKAVNSRFGVTLFFALVITGCSKPDNEVIEYTRSLPNFCEHNASHHFMIEIHPYRYGKVLEKSGWYGKWHTIYSQLCTHYLIWGDYEKSKAFGRIDFFKTPSGHYLGPDYFIAEFLTVETDEFFSRFDREKSDREFLSVFAWDQSLIKLNETLKFETLEGENVFSEWLGSSGALASLKILSARILKGDEDQEVSQAIESLLRNFMTSSDFSHEFLRLLATRGNGNSLEQWLTATILFERYAHQKEDIKLISDIRGFRAEVYKHFPEAGLPNCGGNHTGVFQLFPLHYEVTCENLPSNKHQQ